MMTTPADVRRVAIEHHDRVTGIFEGHYRALESSRFSNSFTYGRSKIDRYIADVFAAVAPGAGVLDVGCGTGEYLRRARRSGLSATGVEPSAAMREIARRNAPDARIENGVATALPFADNSFDVVLLIEVLRYLHRSDIRLALREAARVLRPSGIVVVTLVNRWALDGFYVRQRLRQIRRQTQFDETHPHCEFFAPSEAERELRDAGFARIHVTGRMLAPLRILWKVSPDMAGRVARGLERADDRIHEWRWARAFAGHLIACGHTLE